MYIVPIFSLTMTAFMHFHAPIMLCYSRENILLDKLNAASSGKCILGALISNLRGMLLIYFFFE